MRRVWAVLQVALPWPVKRRLGKWFLNWDVHPTARIGPSIIMVRHLSMGPGSSIGGFNIIRSFDELHLGEGASIGSRNRITGYASGSPIFNYSPHRNPSLILGKRAIITVAHEIDCCDLIEIADFASIAGFNTTILTHSLDLVRDRWSAAPVTVGEHSAVMTGCVLLSGTSVPANSVVSAGSVVNTKLIKEFTFYRGNPAEPVRELPPHLKFFHRTGPLGKQ